MNKIIRNKNENLHFQNFPMGIMPWSWRPGPPPRDLRCTLGKAPRIRC
jgi:hypothetical protein